VAVIILTIATKIVPAQNAFNRWLGLIQRTAIVPYMVWLFIFALTLCVKSRGVCASGIPQSGHGDGPSG
jgi:hypothetical protein